VTTGGDLQTRFFGGGGRSGGERLAIVGTAALNGLGFSPYQTWAFRRADQTAFVESPFICPNGKRATMAQVQTLDPRTGGAERLEKILTACLQQLGDPLGALPENDVVLVVLAAPRRFDRGGAGEGDRRRLEQAIIDALAARRLRPHVSWMPRGHAAFAYAVDQAAKGLEAGYATVALVGGFDTAYDPEVVQDLIDNRRLFDGESQTAAIPGEGAAFALVTRGSPQRTLALAPLGWIDAIATNQEPATLDNDVSTLGLGLSRAARSIARHLMDERRTIDWWITDLTPDPLRVTEFQLAFPRVARGAMLPEGALDNLYENLGDLGAAAMPTALAIAVEGFRRGDPPARTCLVTGSSDDGDRGVVLASAPARG
jgi:3-oxoacyl-[acyl-carrier-protein] synthase-1